MENTEYWTQIEKIGWKYKKIHKILFSYGIFFLIAIFSSIVAYNILSNENEQRDWEDSLFLQKEKKITDFLKKIHQIDQQQTLTGPIALGQFTETNEYIESFNNLVYYKGFVLPRFFWVAKSAPLQPIEYFNKWTYTIDEIDTIFKNIFIGSNKNTTPPAKNASFPLTKDIITDFNLQCVSQSKISNTICDIFITTFLERFFIYNIETDSENFFTITNTIIQQKKYNQKACKGLLYYTYYTEKENETVEKLLQKCNVDEQITYKLFVDFVEVQKELFSKFISNKVYKDEVLNIYKLISFQQIINDDITNKLINPDRLNGYFNFIQEILKRERIPLFYKELTYFFNNYYIKKAIENIEITSKMTNKTEIDTIAKQIISINNGNPLIGYIGLKNQINKNIIEREITISESNTGNISYETKIEHLLEQIKDIDIKQKFISGNNILLYWFWKIETKSDNTIESKITSVATKLRLEEDKNTLLVKQIFFEKFEEISMTINKLIESQKRYFADLQKYIYQNTFLFWDQSANTQNNETEICKQIQDEIPNQEIKTCNNNKVEIDILRKNKVITMIFFHDNFLLKNIEISDNEAKTQLNQYLKNPDIQSQITYNKVTKEDFVKFIKETITWFLTFTPKDDTNFQWSTNTLLIIERIKQYLWIQVNDIVEKNEKILIDFTIGGIAFLWYYNLQEHKIAPIYFKEASTTGSPIAIKNLILHLADEGKPLINMFILQPLEVIKQYSPEEYLLYQKFISEK